MRLLYGRRFQVDTLARDGPGLLEEHGIDELSPCMAPDRNGERMAVAGSGPTGALILIFSEAGLL